MDIFRDSCEVTLKNTNQTHVGTWELLVKTVDDQSTVSSTRKYSYSVIVVGKYNFHCLTFLSYTIAYYIFLINLMIFSKLIKRR